MPGTIYDHSVFAVLTARDQKNKASSAFKLPHNSRWFHEAVGGVAEQPIIDSREATPAEDAQSEDENPGAVDRLVKILSTGYKRARIRVRLISSWGTEERKELARGITISPWTMIFVSGYTITIRRTGPVGYKGQNQKEVRKKETWILTYEPGVPNPFGDITIHLGGLAIKIEFPNHAAADPQYVDNLRAFVNKCKEGVPAVGGLGLDSQATTQAPSEAQTLGDRLIYYKGKSIGKGAFGQVHRLIRVRDGKVFAAKIFKHSTNNKRKLDEVDPVWLTKIRREFTIMKDNPHPNVVQVFEFRETPEPMIIMAYYPLGDIVDAGVINEDKRISTFGQVLDGLSHLHAKGVVHRDLKPENFLVEIKPFYKVVITDFGLSKVVTNNTWLTTFCGSLKYAAPEVFPFYMNGHGPPADIWSLGVIVLEWIYNIPTPPDAPTPKKKGEQVAPEMWRRWVKAWLKELLDKLDDEDDGQVVEILHHMIEPKNEKRWHAIECLMLGFKNGLFKRRAADSLVVCARDQEELDLPTEQEDDGTRTPTRTLLPQQTQAGIDPDATTILENMGVSAVSKH
ncbi:MAG: hypothetical protein Q9187_004583 [Circinaria calcarea]